MLSCLMPILSNLPYMILNRPGCWSSMLLGVDTVKPSGRNGQSLLLDWKVSPRSPKSMLRFTENSTRCMDWKDTLRSSWFLQVAQMWCRPQGQVDLLCPRRSTNSWQSWGMGSWENPAKQRIFGWKTHQRGQVERKLYLSEHTSLRCSLFAWHFGQLRRGT